MSTLDNINENILQKIDIIDKINDLCQNKLKIDFKLHNLNNTMNSNNDYKLITYNINLKLLNKKYLDYYKIKNVYQIQSILFLTEYYSIHNINNVVNNNIISNKLDIYNDSIFLLPPLDNNGNNNNYLLSNDEILSLKNIYYNNYYKYKYYNQHSINRYNNDFQYNQKISKNIYNKFNIFIISENIYNILDNYVDYIYNFLITFKTYIYKYNFNINEIYDDKKLSQYFKKIFILVSSYKKTKLIYDVNLIDYDICSCGNKMVIQSNSSELLCTKCGFIYTLIGSVFEDSQFYNQEGNRYKHGSYDPIRHCKFWIERIQAKENTIIGEDVISKIKKCIEKDKIENLKNISIEQFRMYLKQTNLSKYNDHIPLIKKIITGYIPPQLNHHELQLLFNYFDKATKTYDIIKPKEKSNALYYPFILAKLIQLIVEDPERKRGLLSCIHLQSYNTLIDNDKIWKKICNYNNNFKYIPTDKFNLA